MKDHLRERQIEGLEEVLPMEMEEDFILRHLQKEIRETDRRKNGQYLCIVGRRGRDIPVSSPAEQESPHRTPPTPAPSEDRFFTDWSSLGMGSPLVRTPP